IRVVLEFWRPREGERAPSLSALIEIALDDFGPRVFSRPRQKILGSLELFMLDRLQHVLESRGFPADEVSAVLSTARPAGPDALDDPLDCLVRLRALHRVRSRFQDDFAQLSTAFRRARNLLLKEPSVGEFEEAHLREDAERALYRAIKDSRHSWSGD